MAPVDFPVWLVESQTILATRTICGDEKALDIGDEFLSEDALQRLAERHSQQVASMMEQRDRADD